MKAVILAAGMGLRLKPITEITPKPLIKVGGISIGKRIITMISLSGVNDIVVVTGYMGDKVKNAFIEFALESKVNINFAENKRYHETGTAYSLLMAESYISGDDFLLFESDIVFSSKMIPSMLKAKNTHLVVSKISGSGDEVIVSTTSEGEIQNIGKHLFKDINSLEFIGASCISASFSKSLFSCIRSSFADDSITETSYYESFILKTSINASEKINVLEIPMGLWSEMDTIDDLNRIENKILPEIQKEGYYEI